MNLTIAPFSRPVVVVWAQVLVSRARILWWVRILVRSDRTEPKFELTIKFWPYKPKLGPGPLPWAEKRCNGYKASKGGRQYSQRYCMVSSSPMLSLPLLCSVFLSYAQCAKFFFLPKIGLHDTCGATRNKKKRFPSLVHKTRTSTCKTTSGCWYR